MALLFTSQCAFADFFVLIDSDNNATTGCTFALPTAGTVTGLEHRLTATVSNTVPAQVTQVTLESCAGAAFAAPVTLPGTPYPVGLNIGEAGSDVIELAVARNLIPAFAPLWRLYFAGADQAGDDLLGLSGMAITFAVPGGDPAAIPMLTTWGLFGLIALVFLATLRMRARFPSGVANVLLVGVFVSFVAWAAGFVADGQINDWQGAAPAGTDSMGDSLPATDIVAGFAAIEGPNLFFRIDVANSSNSAPALDLNGPAAGIDFPATFIEGGGVVAAVDDIELTVGDPDTLSLASATATLTNLLDAGAETLAVSAATLSPATPITSSYNA
ncbi:MAG: large repetitive protein, partial [Pseudomonadota bacterium]|nr:large repetitive protein [Pseudomonadota bacterium]